jgi:hypothetical protein
MGRLTITLIVAGSLLSLGACADSTGPGKTMTTPTRATDTRYILASGETPPGDCSSLGNGLWLCDDGNQLQPQSRTSAPSSTATNQATSVR